MTDDEFQRFLTIVKSKAERDGDYAVALAVLILMERVVGELQRLQKTVSEVADEVAAR